jgi:hypothetical protein
MALVLKIYTSILAGLGRIGLGYLTMPRKPRNRINLLVLCLVAGFLQQKLYPNVHLGLFIGLAVVLYVVQRKLTKRRRKVPTTAQDGLMVARFAAWLLIETGVTPEDLHNRLEHAKATAGPQYEHAPSQLRAVIYDLGRSHGASGTTRDMATMLRRYELKGGWRPQLPADPLRGMPASTMFSSSLVDRLKADPEVRVVDLGDLDG